MIGFPALGIDRLWNQVTLTAATCLYASNVALTVLYDMTYAHIDIIDNVKAGIKSIALEHETKATRTGLAAVRLSLLAAIGFTAGLGPVVFIRSCRGAAFTLGTIIRRVQPRDVKNC
jgi:4-hydroxybenzoate polyprenyltransferase